MNITYSCPRCAATNRLEVAGEIPSLQCGKCGTSLATTPGALEGDRLRHCLVCPTGELYLRKDFSQPLGVGIVVAGIVVSTITWYLRWPLATYGVFFGSALLDLALYLSVGNVLQCYYCHSEYRRLPGIDEFASFNLEVHERHRQQAARLAANRSASE